MVETAPPSLDAHVTFFHAGGEMPVWSDYGQRIDPVTATVIVMIASCISSSSITHCFCDW